MALLKYSFKVAETTMNKTFWATLVTLLLSTGQPLALDITSLAPIRGTPGTLVAIDGGPFSSKTQPFLGEHYVEPRIVQDNHLEFTVPLLPPGNYLLTVSTGFGQSQNDEFDLTLNPPEPAPPSPTLSVIEYSETCTVANNDFSVCAVDCPTDRVPTGGGFYMQGTLGNATPHPTVFQSNQFFNGWLVGVYNDLGMELEFTVNAECAKIE